MGVPREAPQAVHDYWASIPQDNCGDLYAKVRPPWLPFGGFWHKVPAWGQLCDGREHYEAVGCMLHNTFPLKGRGWTYVAWRAKPYNPDLCKYPREGVVPKEHQKPFDPERTYDWWR